MGCSIRALPLVCALLGVFPLAITAPAYAGPRYGTVAVNGVTYELPPLGLILPPAAH